MAGYEDLRRLYNQRELDPPFHDLLHSYKVEDDLSTPQLAVSVEVVEHISGQRVSEKEATIADLFELQFLFLLRVGEYTFPKSKHRKTRTTQFCQKDVVFYKNGQKLPHLGGLQILYLADGVTLILDNKKTDNTGQCYISIRTIGLLTLLYVSHEL
mmetsp:Transcript_40250/g.78686  ORF Transcript_40250/g.78686 Transcript_40250/m.78686 type:complete len:156 (-) Transcript_40250:651-1118(-)